MPCRKFDAPHDAGFVIIPRAAVVANLGLNVSAFAFLHGLCPVNAKHNEDPRIVAIDVPRALARKLDIPFRPHVILRKLAAAFRHLLRKVPDLPEAFFEAFEEKVDDRARFETRANPRLQPGPELATLNALVDVISSLNLAEQIYVWRKAEHAHNAAFRE